MTAPPKTVTTGLALPLPYRLFFLVIEPLIAFTGAAKAHFHQAEYLSLTHGASMPDHVPLGMSVILSQLAGMWLLSALIEALVLRSTADLKVWRTMQFAFLVADLGILYSMRPIAGEIFAKPLIEWNSMEIGNLPVVVFRAGVRTAFLLGAGLSGGKGMAGKTTKTTKA